MAMNQFAKLTAPEEDSASGRVGTWHGSGVQTSGGAGIRLQPAVGRA